MRWLTVLTTILALLAILGAVVSVNLWQEVRDTTNQNRANAVRACQNTNESRAANLRLWSFVLDVSAANGKKRTPQERVQLEQIRAWITALYAPHDCSELGRPYPIPDPPRILGKG
jgi:hypothetical protein